MLEDSLRDAFADRVAQPHAMDDPAGRAIVRARQIRHRQLLAGGVVGLCTLAVVLSVAAAGMVHPSRSPGQRQAGDAVTPAVSPPPETEPAAQRTAVSPAARPVDVVDRELHTAQGRTLKLPLLDSAREAYRVADGWLLVEYVPAAKTKNLWYVDRTSEKATVIIRSATWVAVAVDGARVAWVQEKMMAVAQRVGAELRSRRITGAPEPGGPIGFIGAGVLLGRTATGGGIDSYDMWFPDRGEYLPTWGAFAAVFGGRPDGRELYAMTSRPDGAKQQLCLVRVDADTMTTTQTACGLLTQVPDFGWVAPDGHWLVLPQGDKLVSIDMTTVFDRPRTTGTWDIAGAGRDAAWLDSNTLVVRSRGQLRVLSMVDPKRVETYPLPSADQLIVGQ